jgi:hypothetical protein
MNTQIDFKTSVKRNDTRIDSNSSTKFVVGNSVGNVWNWNTPVLDEHVESSLLGTIYILIDGFSDCVVSDDSADLALNAIQKHIEKLKGFSSLTLDINREIRISFLEAHHAIIENSKVNAQEAGTNIFLAWIIDDKLYAGWNSECNFYAFQHETLELLDDDPMAICSNLNFEDSDQLIHHEYIGCKRNPPSIKTLKNDFVNLNEVDRLLFCSYQFHQVTSGFAIENILRDVKVHEETTPALMKAANEAGGFTNNSLWLIDFEKIKEGGEEKKDLKKRYVFPFLALIVAAGIGFVGGSQFSNLEFSKQTSGVKTASIPMSYSLENPKSEEVSVSKKPELVVKKAVVKRKKVPKKEPVVLETKRKVLKPKKKALTGRMKVLEEKVIDWNDKKFLLLKKMNALEAFLAPSSPEALKELNALKEKRTHLNSGLFEMIQLDQNRKPVYDEKNKIFLSASITEETVEQKFWKLHNQLEALEKDLKDLCKRYYCKDLIK